jgi:hypothetical protein
MAPAPRRKDQQSVVGLLIQTAGPADVPEIARLHLASYRAAYRDLLPAAFLAGLTLADRERRWARLSQPPPRATSRMTP